MDGLKYTEKCLEMLLTKQFTVFENDPTKPQKSKKQHTLRKLKSKCYRQKSLQLLRMTLLNRSDQKYYVLLEN